MFLMGELDELKDIEVTERGKSRVLDPEKKALIREKVFEVVQSIPHEEDELEFMQDRSIHFLGPTGAS
jgi:hypothetical protein